LLKALILNGDELNFEGLMSEEIPMANPALSAEEQSVIAQLTDADRPEIDIAILANCSNRWLKVARVTLNAEKALGDRYPSLSYIFYTQRLIHLAEQGRLHWRGHLEYMRFSEVRLPSAES
jgi:Protein of unknown function